jgi:hypothetical protein
MTDDEVSLLDDEFEQLAATFRSRGHGWHPLVASIEAAKVLEQRAAVHARTDPSPSEGAGAGPASRTGTTQVLP